MVNDRRQLPTGEVTFLFTDIADSTLLLRELGPERYAEALAEHRRLVRKAVDEHGGIEVDTQGDAFFIVFETARAAIASAGAARLALADGPIQVRMGLHTGTPMLAGEGYVGEDVHIGARIGAAGHGGQVLVSRQTRDRALASAATGAQDELEFVDLGEHRVKGFASSVWLYQLGTAKHPPLRTIANTNLPRPASTFVGREAEVAELCAMLQDGARLVTLTGPGGTGKSRLALETAAMLVQEFRNGVFWVPIAAITDSQLVTQAIAETIGANGGLAEHIADREMLLLIDNFEQVVEAAPDISNLVSTCPALRVLITSRELLRVSGETDYPVSVLPETDGVALFRERSGLANDAAMSELCARLDYLPLAIELAAARARMLSVQEILHLLSQRLDALKGGRDTDPRQLTLRATISWSFDLLSDAEQQLFARLAVFRGGCTFEAASEVAEADLDTLQSLLEKSLVRRVDGRFRMLETIREFAVERLAGSEQRDVVAARHADHFLALVEQAEERLTGPDQELWWRRLTDDIENIRAALEWSCSGSNPSACLRLSGSMWRYWWQRGHYHEGKAWYRVALDLAAHEPDSRRAHAVSGLGSMELGLGNTESAIELFESCLEVFRRESNYEQTVRTLTDLGIAYTDTGDLERARDSLEEALAMTRAARDRRREAVLLINLSDLAMVEADPEAAAPLARSAFEAMLEVGDEQSAANALSNYALEEFMRGETETARPLFADAIRRARHTDDRYMLVHAMIAVAALLTADSEFEIAATLIGRAETFAEEMAIAINPTEERIYEETVEQLRSALSGEDLEAARGRGQRLEHEAALDLMLAQLDAGSVTGVRTATSN